MYFERHQERNKEVANSLPEVFPSYYKLYDISVDSRYGCVKDNPSPSEAKDIVDIDLRVVAGFIEGLA
jgi:hypothetical protein